MRAAIPRRSFTLIRSRVLAASLVAGMSVAGSTANATTCPFITDATGDSRTTISVTVPPPNTYWANADITSVDVVSDGSWLTGVVRFASLEQSPSLLTPGTNVVLSFNSSTGSMFELWAEQTTVGDEFYAVTRSPSNVSTVFPVSGTIDTTAAEMRIHVPASALTGHVTTGDVFSDFQAAAGAREGMDVADRTVLYTGNFSWDFARSTAGETYTAGDAGCVTPGV